MKQEYYMPYVLSNKNTICPYFLCAWHLCISLFKGGSGQENEFGKNCFAMLCSHLLVDIVVVEEVSW